MVLSWFGSQDVSDLIARGKFSRAIEILRKQLDEDPKDSRVRMQLADALVGDGQTFEAVPILLDLADQFGSEGQAPKAIAVLKKVQRIDPGRRDVETQLAQLIKGKGKKAPAAAATAWGEAPAHLDKVGFEPTGSVMFSEDHFKPAPVVTPQQRIQAARAANWVPSTHAEEAPVGYVPPVPAVPTAPERTMPAPPPPPPVAATPAPNAEPMIEPEPASEVPDSPLFSGFTQDELIAVIRGLQLHTFEAGDIILTEGDPGDSLFVVSTGLVKTYVKRDGRQAKVRELEEGEFFGEISILSGKPRTATVTAATHCELLELDRATLDGITRDYPHVQQVLEDFYMQRAAG